MSSRPPGGAVKSRILRDSLSIYCIFSQIGNVMHTNRHFLKNGSLRKVIGKGSMND